jgi:WD40 repeat protein
MWKLLLITILTAAGIGQAASSRPTSSPSATHFLPILRQDEQGEDMRTHVRDGAFYANGRRIITVSPYQKIELWDTETGKRLAKMGISAYDHDQNLTEEQYFAADIYLRCVAITPVGTRAFLGGERNTPIVWDVPNKRILDTWGDKKADGNYSAGPHYAVYRLQITPDGKYLLMKTRETVELRSVATGKRLRIFHRKNPDAQPPSVGAVVLSSDGKYLLARVRNKFIVSEVQTGRRIQELSCSQRKDESGIGNIAFSPDGRLVHLGVSLPMFSVRRTVGAKRPLRSDGACTAERSRARDFTSLVQSGGN